MQTHICTLYHIQLPRLHFMHFTDKPHIYLLMSTKQLIVGTKHISQPNNYFVSLLNEVGNVFPEL